MLYPIYYAGFFSVCQSFYPFVNSACMCQAFIGNVSFNERRVFEMQLPELCLMYVYSKAHRLAAALV
jgi:hypothetical protein